MQALFDGKYHFASFFNRNNGFYLRTGILDNIGHDTGKEPNMSSFPHLIDVGIMGHCAHGLSGLCKGHGFSCYQNGSIVNAPNMSLDLFSQIIAECKGRVFQFALGGRGDPNLHEEFASILNKCIEASISPNYTTSGYQMTCEQIDLSIAFCGRVAVSWYESYYTYFAINEFYRRGKPVNLHFVVSSSSIRQAIEILENDYIKEKVHSIIFLLYKPIGSKSKSNILSYNDTNLQSFFDMATNVQHQCRIGFDSCFVPGIVSYSESYDPMSIDSCESGRFSCYIDAVGNMYPCSFIQQEQYSYTLINGSIENGWNCNEFDAFRRIHKDNCQRCRHSQICSGGCPSLPEINLCEGASRND